MNKKTSFYRFRLVASDSKVSRKNIKIANWNHLRQKLSILQLFFYFLPVQIFILKSSNEVPKVVINRQTSNILEADSLQFWSNATVEANI